MNLQPDHYEWPALPIGAMSASCIIIIQKGIDFYYSFGTIFFNKPLFRNLGAIAIYRIDEITMAIKAFTVVVIAFYEANAFAALSIIISLQVLLHHARHR